MMKKGIYFLLFVPMLTAICCAGQTQDARAENAPEEKKDTTVYRLTMLVAGDLMQHSPQISAARQKDGTYNYDDCFQYVKREIQSADLAIANFEVTLGGPPYKGYPCFSAPDEYLKAIIDAGFDVLTTGNNHCLDTGRKGLERTNMMLDSLHVPHLGTYDNDSARQASYPLLVEKNGFRIALLNFTYATNGLVVKQPNHVNYIDTVEIAADIEKAKTMNPDLIIAIPHWGIEYAMTPNKPDVNLADWLIEKGVDHVIGGHPHVLQPFEWRNPEAEDGGTLVAYSLGNFISNQSKPNTGMGSMVKLHFTKKDGRVKLDSCAYALTWCSRPAISRKRNYRIVPAANSDSLLNAADRNLRDADARRARLIFDKHNKNIKEYKF